MNVIEFDFESVSYLIGTGHIEVQAVAPYDEATCSFLADLSSRLLADSEVRQYPDVASFAYWCRKKNIEFKKEQAMKSALFEKRIGRGLTFHVAPSNVPVNFAFSFVFSLLAGNANIVRVPTRPFPQIEIICRAIRDTLNGYPRIAARTAFVSYEANDEVTAAFSARADARILWGGDTTVTHIQALPHKARCVDILFADRYSVALIDGSSIGSLSEKDLEVLAGGFYNDTYLMDQNACSSPQMVFWLNATAPAKQLFWDAVKRVVVSRYDMQDVLAVDKYVELCRLAIDGAAATLPAFDGWLSVVGMDPRHLGEDITALRGVGGLFFECDIDSVDDIACYVNEKFQTLVYHGCDPRELASMVYRNGLCGVDRIVPIGQAMDIDIIWDGYDLVGDLSRVIDVR